MRNPFQRVKAFLIRLESLQWTLLSEIVIFNHGQMTLQARAFQTSSKTLEEVEHLFREVNIEEFTNDAEALGSWDSCNEDVAI